MNTDITAYQIVYKYGENQMSGRPEYYAGRGNSTEDLSPKMLERLYKGITQEKGPDAAKNFVNMVHALEKQGDVSATTFLTSLYRLETTNWTFAAVSSTADAIAETLANADRSGNKTKQAAAGMGLMLSAFSSDNGTPASYIVGDFLKRHQSELTEKYTGTIRCV